MKSYRYHTRVEPICLCDFPGISPDFHVDNVERNDNELHFTLSINRTTQPGQLVQVMDKVFKMNVTSYESNQNKKIGNKNGVDASSDNLWLIEVDMQNKSAVTNVKTDSF